MENKEHLSVVCNFISFFMPQVTHLLALKPYLTFPSEAFFPLSGTSRGLEPHPGFNLGTYFPSDPAQGLMGRHFRPWSTQERFLEA